MSALALQSWTRVSVWAGEKVNTLRHSREAGSNSAEVSLGRIGNPIEDCKDVVQVSERAKRCFHPRAILTPFLATSNMAFSPRSWLCDVVNAFKLGCGGGEVGDCSSA